MDWTAATARPFTQTTQAGRVTVNYRTTTEVDQAQIQPDSNIHNAKGIQTENSKSVPIYQ